MDEANQTKIRRRFSEELKRRLVEQIENRLISVTEVHRQYSVSRTVIYKWIARYSPTYAPGVRQVVELESEALIAKQLREHIADLERALGRQQLKIEVLEAVIEYNSDTLGMDLKKKLGTPSSSVSPSGAAAEAR
jgi:transposase-like protein